jgi:hypothetical protein
MFLPIQALEPAPNCCTSQRLGLRFGGCDTNRKHIVLHRAQLRRIGIEPAFRSEFLDVCAPDGWVVVDYPGADADYGLERKVVSVKCQVMSL